MIAMPFDAANPPIEVIFQQRRERAATFWGTIPDIEFDISTWESGCPECNTTACALGWLANSEFEGWSWVARIGRIPRGPDGETGFHAAMLFFGLSNFDARRCFHSHYYTSPRRLSTVAERLLTMPITVPA
jgi:hypothetical protein